MPKIKEKPPAKQAETVKLIEPKPEPQVVVFRLFECLMRLEEASSQISKVGIFPGPESRALEFQAKLKAAKSAVDDIHKVYLSAWGEMRNQAEWGVK